MSTPAVTVVVPTYGRPQQIRRCLDALAMQIMPSPWEVIVVDDGSPEPLTGLGERLCGCVPLRVVRQQHSGPAQARNRGAAEARGDFLAFTDDDCLPGPMWLASLIDRGHRTPAALVGGSTRNGLPDALFSSTSQLIVDLVYEHFNTDTEQAYFFASNNMLCSRAQLLALGGFDRSFPRAGAEDRDLCDRWRMKGWPLVWNPAAQVEHRHPQGLATFLRIHFRYGRGAYLYQSKRRQRRSGSIREDLKFHRSLLTRLRTRHKVQCGTLHGPGLYAALAAWQVANAAGFAFESAVTRLARRRP